MTNCEDIISSALSPCMFLLFIQREKNFSFSFWFPFNKVNIEPTIYRCIFIIMIKDIQFIICAKIILFYTYFIASSRFRYWYPRCIDLETVLQRGQLIKVIKIRIQVSNVDLTSKHVLLATSHTTLKSLPSRCQYLP